MNRLSEEFLVTPYSMKMAKIALKCQGSKIKRPFAVSVAIEERIGKGWLNDQRYQSLVRYAIIKLSMARVAGLPAQLKTVPWRQR